MRILRILVAVVLGVAGAWAEDAVPPPAMDAAFAGVWQMDVKNAQGEWTFIWDVAKDGTYATRSKGTGNPPGETGRFEASGGRWSLKSTAAREDQGTYAFQGKESVIMTGKLGTGVWRRTAAASQRAADPGPPSGEQAGRIEAYAAQARYHAGYWQADAILVEVLAQAGTDGRVNAWAGPGAAVLSFLSPGTGQGLLAMPKRDGGVRLIPFPTAVSTAVKALPLPLPEMADAHAAALKNGLVTLPANGNAAGASLRYHTNSVQRTETLAWCFSGVGTGTLAVIDPATKQALNLFEITGRNDLARIYAAWNAGEARGGPSDYATLLKEALAYMAKLDPGVKPFRIDIFGSNAGGLAIGEMQVTFFNPLKKESWGFQVRILPKRVSGSTTDIYATSNPVAMPAGTIDAEAACAALARMGTNLPANVMNMQLLCISAQAYDDHPDPLNNHGILVRTDPPAEKGRWIWRCHAKRAGGFGGGKADHSSHLEYIYVDATTSKPLP